MEKALFAGGCFWCMVKPFDQLPGIEQVVSGYTGGHTVAPSYEQVCSGTTGHTEAVEITFDPTLISYEELLEIYWQQTDPTDAFGQFADRGDSYRPVIFVNSPQQERSAERSKRSLAESGRFSEPIVTTIEAAGPFYPAEAYHQAFYQKEPDYYRRYRKGSGRSRFIRDHWNSETPKTTNKLQDKKGMKGSGSV